MLSSRHIMKSTTVQSPSPPETGSAAVASPEAASSAPAQVLGSITGRTQPIEPEGRVSELQGSFHTSTLSSLPATKSTAVTVPRRNQKNLQRMASADEDDRGFGDHPPKEPPRSRTYSAPPEIVPVEVSRRDAPPTLIAPAASSTSTSTTNTTTTTNSASRTRLLSSDEIDEEIRMAQAMAMAIKNNPHLTPEEIRQLVGAPKSVVGQALPPPQQQQQQPSLAAAGQRLSSFFQTATSALSDPNPSSTAVVGPNHNNTNTMSALTSAIPATAAVGTSSSLLVSYSAAASSEGDKKKSVRAGFKNFTESIKLAARTNLVNLSGSNGSNHNSYSSGGDDRNMLDALAAPVAATMATTTTITTTGTTSTTGSAKRAMPFRVASTTASSVSTMQQQQQSPSNGMTLEPLKIPGRHGSIPHSVSESLATPSLTTSSTSTPTFFDKATPDFGFTSSLAAASSLMTATATTPVTSDRSKSDPIRVSTLAWKRRGGMGKFATSAWERRRIELAGTKLLYYLKDGDDETDGGTVNGSSSGLVGKSDDTTSIANNNSFAEDATGTASRTIDESLTVFNRRTTWLEQAAANFANVTAMAGSSSDPTQPRGYLDLAKEKATVQAAFGHSGAPSPFALSIKVRGETKWKLCFDHHKTQMEWLAAITDVVVQGSVDAYNANLLAAADPGNIGNEFFHPQYVNEPPPGSTTSAATHRLWMLEPYTVESATGLASVDDESESGDDDTLFDSASCVDEPTDPVLMRTEMAEDRLTCPASSSGASQALDPAGAQKEAIDRAETCRVVPEANLLYLASVVNAALAVARASSTTMEGFWYLVVVVNFALGLCTSKQPDWRSFLNYIRDVPADAAASSKSSRSLSAIRRKTTAATTSKVAPVPFPTKLQKPGYIPTAGCSTVKLKTPTDAPVNDKNQVFAGWRVVPGDIMSVRSHGYLVSHKKIPSPGELYECVNVDIFESPSRYPDMATRVKLPECKFDDGEKPKTWRTPDFFIISIALPTDPPKFGRSTSDGGGYTVTMYFKMRQETRNILRRVTADGYDPSQEVVEDPQTSQVNAVRLLEEWCRRAPTDPKFQARFKVVPNAHNLKEIGVPSWISKYNGKPFLIKRAGETGFLYTHPELSCVEFDISLHPFPYLAKQGICFMKENYFKKILVSFGFVIEGRADDELPECLIGLMQLCYPDPVHAIQAEDFFAGTCPRSF